jgi:hypothetical protein
MINARMQKKIAGALAVSCLTAALFTPGEVQAAAGGIQRCVVSTDCTIGEFLFDDNSSPISGASCVVNSNYPNGSTFLSGDPMSGGGGDGWYYKTINESTTGLYPTTVSCTVSGDTLTIDKSFEVVTPIESGSGGDPDAIASAVWNFGGGRTLTSFGNLVADIWSYSTRSLNSFGDLIAGIWSSATRTLTGGGLDSGSIATKNDIDDLSIQIDEIEGGGGSTTNVTNVTNNNTSVTNVTNTADNSSIEGTINEIKSLSQETRFLLEKVVNKPIIENILEETSPDLSEKIKDTRGVSNQVYVNNQYLLSQFARLGANWERQTGKELLATIVDISGVLGDTADSASANTVFGQVNWIRDSWSWDVSSNIHAKLVEAKKLSEGIKLGLSDYNKNTAQLAQTRALVQKFIEIEKLVGKASDTSYQNTLFGKIRVTQDIAVKLDSQSNEIGKALTEIGSGKKISPSMVEDIKNKVLAVNNVPGVLGVLTKADSNDPISIQNALLGLRGIVGSNMKLLSGPSNKTLVNSWLEIGSIVFKTLATNPSTLISQDVQIKYYLPPEIRREDVMRTDPGLEVKYDSEKDQFFVEGTFMLAAGETRSYSVQTKDIWEVTPEEIASLRQQADELYKPLEKTAYYAQGVTLRSDIHASLDQIASLQSRSVTPEDKIRAYREAEILAKSVEGKISGLRDLVTQASAAGNLFGFVGGAQTIAVWGLIIVIAAGFILMTTYMRTVMGEKEVNEAKEHFEKPKKTDGGRATPLKLIGIMIASSVISAAGAGLIVGKVVSSGYEEKLTTLGLRTENVEDLVFEEENGEMEEYADGGTGGPYVVTIDNAFGGLAVRSTPGGDRIGIVFDGDLLIYLDENDYWYQVELETGESGWVSKKYSSKE